MQRRRITHWSLFRRRWGSISATLVLVLASTLLWLAQPYVLGIAINDLTEGAWLGTAMLVGVQLAVIVIGGVRRMLDTRVYGRLYREVSTEVVVNSQQAGLGLTRIAARASMLREVVKFFEHQVPRTIRAFVNLAGSLVLLWLLAPPVFFVCLAGGGFVFGLTLLVGRRLFRLNAELNDELEREVAVLEGRDADEVEAHFASVTRHRVAKSDLEVVIYGLSTAALSVALIFGLYWMIAEEGAAIGTVFSVFTYVIRFQMAATTVPATYQETVRTLEITRRINDLGERAETPARAKGPMRKSRSHAEAEAARMVLAMSRLDGRD